MSDSDSYEERSSSPGYPPAQRVGDHLVIDVEQWCPGSHPEPHLRHPQQTGYWERYLRCLRCETEALRVRDFPESCNNPTFTRGSLVTDEQNPESPAVVIQPDVGRADRHRVDGTTVADYQTNAGYPRDDRVVRVCFTSWLDAYVPGWREWDPLAVSVELGDYAREYGIEVQYYDYPESRLEPAYRNETEQPLIAADGGER